jgi:hypoxia up-regulated 1
MPTTRPRAHSLAVASASAALLVAFVLACCAPSPSHALAVMSIDLGGEWLKVALVKPSIPMEIVNNAEGKRKTPSTLAINDNEQLFGEPARIHATKRPLEVISHVQMLLGQRPDSPLISLFRTWFPHLSVNASSSGRDSVAIVRTLNGNQLTLTPEEITATMLAYAREYAEAAANEPVTAAVITVPHYFTNTERRIVLSAASLVGIEVLQLMNENTAVALHFGVFNFKQCFSDTPQYYVFYDIGALNARATLVRFSLEAPPASAGAAAAKAGKIPVVEIVNSAYDRYTGGAFLDMCLREHFADAFNSAKGVKSNVRNNPRAMAKLLREARRVKEILSANTETSARLEDLQDGVEFKISISRSQLEKLCAPIIDRVAGPLHAIVPADGDVSWSQISQLVLVGGTTRIPAIQKLLKDISGKDDLGKNINADEAAALGAIYQAAHLAKGFRVKNFVVRDTVTFAVEAAFPKLAGAEASAESGSGVESSATAQADAAESLSSSSNEAQPITKRSLFETHLPFPVRKRMTFSNRTEDFDITLTHVPPASLNEEHLALLPDLAIATTSVRGIADAIANSPDALPKHVRVHFSLNKDGIVGVDRAEIILEPTEVVSPADATALPDADKDQVAASKSTFENIADNMRRFFGSSSSESSGDSEEATADSTDEDGAESSTSSAEDDASATSSSSASSPEDTEGPRTEVPPESSSESQSSSDAPPSDTEEPAAADAEKSGAEEQAATASRPPPPPSKGKKQAKKNRNLKRPLLVNTVQLSSVLPLASESTEISTRYTLLRNKELERRERQQVRNDLEAFVYNTREKLSDDEQSEFISAQEKETLLTALQETGDWIYADGANADVSAFQNKRSILDDLVAPWMRRVLNDREVPPALRRLKNVMNTTKVFLVAAAEEIKNDTELPRFNQTELDDLQAELKTVSDWLSDTEARQNAMAKSDDPALRAQELDDKGRDLERSTQILVRRRKPILPRIKKPASTVKNDTDSTSESASESQDAPQPDAEQPEAPKTSKTADEGETTEDSSTAKPSNDAASESDQAESPAAADEDAKSASTEDSSKGSGSKSKKSSKKSTSGNGGGGGRNKRSSSGKGKRKPSASKDKTKTDEKGDQHAPEDL